MTLDNSAGCLIRIVRTIFVTATQSVGPFVQKLQIKLHHLIKSGSLAIMFQQRWAWYDPVAAVIVVTVRQPDQHVITMRSIGRHHEDDVDIPLEPGVPLLAKLFGKTPARTKVDAWN